MDDRDERRRQTGERLHVLDAICAAVERRDELMAIVGPSASADEARRALQQHFGFDEIQATAALDLQARRFAALERNRILDERDSLRHELAELTPDAEPHGI